MAERKESKFRARKPARNPKATSLQSRGRPLDPELRSMQQQEQGQVLPTQAQSPQPPAMPSGPATKPATGNVLNARQNLFAEMQSEMTPDNMAAYKKKAASLGVTDSGFQKALDSMTQGKIQRDTIAAIRLPAGVAPDGRGNVDTARRSMPIAVKPPPVEGGMPPPPASTPPSPLFVGPPASAMQPAAAPSFVGPPSPVPTSGSAPTYNSTSNGRGAKTQQREQAATPPPATPPAAPAPTTASRQEAMGNFIESAKSTVGAVMSKLRNSGQVPTAPDGSKVVPTNLRTQKDAKGNVTSYDLAPLVKNGAGPDVRINRATGLPFGYSQGQAMPAGADAAMKQRGADHKARMDANVAQTKSRFANMPAAAPAAAAAPKPAAQPVSRAGMYAPGKDPMDRYSPETYARTDAARATGFRRQDAERAVREGGADAMSQGQRKEFGKMYGDTKLYEGSGMTQRPAATAPSQPSMAAADPNKPRMSRFRR